MDGLYTMTPDGKNRKKVCNLEKVSNIIRDNNGVIWIQNVYGKVWRQSSYQKFLPCNEAVKEATAVLVQFADTIRAIDALATFPIPFPQFSYFDGDITWLTNNEGTQLYGWRNGREIKDLDYLYPFKSNTINAMLHDEHQLWLGNNKGFSIIDTNVKDPAFLTKPKVHIRSIGLGSDTILWGGFGLLPEEILLDSKERNVTFTYSLNAIPIVNKAYYRYQLNDGRWSAWTTEQTISFYNLPYGNYTFRVEGLDAFGHKTDVTELNFSISFPYYLRWYMIILYLFAAGFILYLIYKMRIRMLQKEKLRLEQVVQERTAEIVKQKDEIQEKSESLELALNELHSAQNQLIRQEKMATVGKLTQGLIDRILNPLNYINNFSKLSEGLVRDVEANIEDEKEHMSEDNYEDTIDVLGMLKGNLLKVSEHGQNTTRTLKAMEEMLKDRSGGIVKTDIIQLFKHAKGIVDTYYSKQEAEQHINVIFDYPSEPVFANANPELLSKVFMSMLSNSFYAVDKKFAKGGDYSPEVSLKAKVIESQMSIIIHDNGIGIEENIINKIFDPFFTTKTTGEAAGIGLYLSHDIIQSYGGTITANSVKDQFSDFTITLPIIIKK
jgi:signal transduction histidine kinase